MHICLVSDVDSNNEMFISGCFGCRLNVWSFPACQKLQSIKACHPINCVSIEQHPVSNLNTTSGCRSILAATCSRTGKINSFSPNVVLWNIVSGDCLKKFDLPSACFVQVRFKNRKRVNLCAATIIIEADYLSKFGLVFLF